MYLVIVESPAKAKVINKYLGSNYNVVSCYGHIRDLPSKNGSVEPDKDFEMHYEITPSSYKHVKQITDLAKKSDAIYLATDPDREGEAISWHIAEVLKSKKALKKGVSLNRIAFHEITKKAVEYAVANPREISEGLVDAQQARRALDYLVGFNLSPILWRKLPGSRSAGRVQSVALRLICEREDEIDRFITQEYWSIRCLFNGRGADFYSSLFSIEGKKLEKLSLSKEALVTPIVEKLKNSQYSVIDVEKKQQRRNPYAPFITSTLQQEASGKLGFGAKKTMLIAQKLYEGINIGGETVGLITYMRTDGTQLSQDAVSEAREYIGKNFGDRYLPKSPIVYKTKVKNAQEAHEAIRPTSVFNTPDKLRKYLEKDFLELYTLIWQRMLACQMASAILDQVNVLIETKDKYAQLRATGSVIAFDGFYKVYNTKKDLDSKDDDEEGILPDLKIGDDLLLKDVLPKQHFTEPLPRYSEASLVKKLEELGIGRPSTYASIISVLQDRKYVRVDKRRFFPEDRGRFVTAFLVSCFKKYVEYDFTAHLEDSLDLVSDHQLNWKELLRDFWVDFNKNVTEVSKYTIEQVMASMAPLIEHYVFPKAEDGSDPRLCPDCKKGALEIKLGKFGPFVACHNYPECNYTRHLHENHDGEEEDSEHVVHHDKSFGIDERTGLEIMLKKGPFGLYLQLGKSKKDKGFKRVHVPEIFKEESLDLSSVQSILLLPREIGSHPVTKGMIFAGIGKYGPYLLHNKKYTSLEKVEDVFNISLDSATTLIDSSAKAKAGKNLGKYQDEDIMLLKGKFGPYLKHGKSNFKIPKNTDVSSIDLEKAVGIISSK